MKLSLNALIFASMALVGHQVLASPQLRAERRNADGPTISTLTYRGPITPGGDDVTLSGTAEDIHRQIRERNPTFNPDDFPSVRDAKAKRAAEGDLVARTGVGRVCDIPGETVSTSDIQENIRYVRDLPGNCNVDGGPSKCARISCSYGNAIFFCNDNAYPLSIACNYLATNYAEWIVTACQQDGRVKGQRFDTENWNVIIKRDSC
ncbi:MAG: hypothetical protein M1817_000996 [Caeruleum heppii]|nr:MAG: hypothetical protein M1817_000996 [Caeruleum heppii]